MKKNFITGLAILLPFVITALLFIFLVNLLTKPFVGIVENLFDSFGFSDTTIGFFHVYQIVPLLSRLIVVVFLILLTFLFGFLGRIVFFNFFLKIGNQLIHKIPFINKIYKAVQDVIHTLFQNDSKSFSKVVLIPFPTDRNLSIGLITREGAEEKSDNLYGEISVFVPATPNPTMGFMILYRKDQLIYLDMSVEEALKFVVSFGVMASPFENEGKDKNFSL